MAKTLQNLHESKATMTLSIKPFGCMPSSTVSDGVQSYLTEKHPDLIFLPVETNGDGEVNLKSRVQMQLFKARKAAQNEVEAALQRNSLTMDEVRSFVAAHPEYSHALARIPRKNSCAAADLVDAVGAAQPKAEGPSERSFLAKAYWFMRSR